MTKITVNKSSNYPVSAIKIKKAVKKTLLENGIKSDSSAAITIVGHNKMQQLVKKYYRKSGIEPKGYIHPVLTFPNSEAKTEFVNPPGKIIDLGEIIISFKAVIEKANRENKLVDDIATDLAIHGALHLIGKHHD